MKLVDVTHAGVAAWVASLTKKGSPRPRIVKREKTFLTMGQVV